MKIIELPLHSLRPYEKNARLHKEKDIETIIASIEDYGFNDPIGIWSDDNLIVEGHGRYMAAQELGLETVPCIRLDHLTDEERRAYAIAHNSTAELSGWNFEILDEELEALGQEIDMTRYGFEETMAELPDSFFDIEEKQDAEPKRIQCPECGEWFEV